LGVLHIASPRNQLLQQLVKFQSSHLREHKRAGTVPANDSPVCRVWLSTRTLIATPRRYIT
jgi:hypothetical protein